MLQRLTPEFLNRKETIKTLLSERNEIFFQIRLNLNIFSAFIFFTLIVMMFRPFIFPIFLILFQFQFSNILS